MLNYNLNYYYGRNSRRKVYYITNKQRKWESMMKKIKKRKMVGRKIHKNQQNLMSKCLVVFISLWCHLLLHFSDNIFPEALYCKSEEFSVKNSLSQSAQTTKKTDKKHNIFPKTKIRRTFFFHSFHSGTENNKKTKNPLPKRKKVSYIFGKKESFRCC